MSIADLVWRHHRPAVAAKTITNLLNDQIDATAKALTLPILFRIQLRSLPGQLSFRSVVQALLISATRASLALHASENSAACVFTQSLMRPPPGLTSAHFALISAAQAPNDRSFAVATGAERSTTAQITTILFIIGHSPKKPMRLPSLALACVRCARSTGSVWWTIKTVHSIDICQRVLGLGQAVQPEERHHELRRNRASDAARREREEEVAIASAHPGLHGSAKMENPTKASTATLRTIIAIAATSMTESRLRSNAMMRYWAAVERPL